jgi:hypothetical protein
MPLLFGLLSCWALAGRQLFCAEHYIEVFAEMPSVIGHFTVAAASAVQFFILTVLSLRLLRYIGGSGALSV